MWLHCVIVLSECDLHLLHVSSIPIKSELRHTFQHRPSKTVKLQGLALCLYLQHPWLGLSFALAFLPLQVVPFPLKIGPVHKPSHENLLTPRRMIVVPVVIQTKSIVGDTNRYVCSRHIFVTIRSSLNL